jgi:hypothetical protein
MTISAVINKNIYTGTATTYEFAFPIYDDDELKVVSTTSAGVETTLTKTTHYIITTPPWVPGIASGTISLVAGTTFPSGGKLTLYRETVQNQLLNLANQSAFVAEDVEEAIDKLTAMVQDVSERVDRAVIAQVSSDAADAAVTETVANARYLAKAGGAMTGAIAMGDKKITGLAGPGEDSTAATNKEYVDTQDATFLPLLGGIMVGDINANANQITSLKAGTHNSSDAARMVDLHAHTHNGVDSVSIVPGAAIAMGNAKITGLATPTADTDASTKKYVDDQGALYLPVTSPTVTGTLTMDSGNIDAGSFKVTNMGEPTSGQDAATKNYVDTQDTYYAYTADNDHLLANSDWSTIVSVLADTYNATDEMVATVAGRFAYGSGSDTTCDLRIVYGPSNTVVWTEDNCIWMYHSFFNFSASVVPGVAGSYYFRLQGRRASTNTAGMMIWKASIKVERIQYP